MKIYISADIEGVTGVTHWDETYKNKTDYFPFQKQMVDEINATIKGLASALDQNCEFVIQDAHHTGRNILHSDILENYDTKLISGWSYHPFSMVQELDETFDCVVMVGYHSPASSPNSPLSHSMNTDLVDITLNGRSASEFLLHTYCASYFNVPVIFISGDEGITKEAKKIAPNIKTVAVKKGVGDSTINIHPKLALKKIELEAKNSLYIGDLTEKIVPLPDNFYIEIQYNKHQKAFKNSFYPGAKLISPTKIGFKSENYFEIMRYLLFVL